ncbi:bifunctional helix-turn-helix transcriptional regulator/GNAT family N-acetyltransferase [Gillisia marina]|uniref:bifunctional helix-turn-helix transcriptional regulator/GNAT family N-acetyltransferase n=1 Tax=Gillisia marina TaxID=1167637 RepID=UPI00029B4A15|nr:bifunctional helix-turn-helix transcriptional regulator/GNAT family N-acetyltransferase [Gillisia marina]
MFYNQVGNVALGSRLRMLSEKITEDAKQIYSLYGVNLKPKWFPVFYVLSQSEGKSITVIAKIIGHSHPSVSKIVREMAKEGIVMETSDKEDGRKNIVQLTAKGQRIAVKIEDQYLDVNFAVEEALAQTKNNLWKAMDEFEFLLDRKSLLKRVQDQKKIREMKNVSVVPYESKYRSGFKKLNEDWIKKYFKIEEADSKALDHPKEYILDKGGDIFIALYNGNLVGVCALLKMDHPDYDYELAKMAVSDEAKGKGIGWLLGEAVVKKAKSLNARNVYLESNTKLTPAISLYHKLGFKKVAGPPTPYERCNIQMELKF